MTIKTNKKIDWKAKYHKLFIKYLALKQQCSLIRIPRKSNNENTRA